ncbi:phytanoyl-CoA dioxygenase family protein [Panacagrimonas perspica]|nr:phytanoyl-CoA dioxygenase family protein [Panacagrimonas perspica]THD02090.1 phytanoyl-CoA dioxygenase family protein [Panacagrimonas perspica]
MTPYDLPKLSLLTDVDVQRFRRDGFLIVERVLSEDRIALLRDRFPKIFAGQFDTGVYPDEWHWREGMSLPDVTRHMSNAWKADLTIASLALSADIGRAVAQLSGWSGAKLGLDTIWWKPPQTKAIALHQDSSFSEFLNPALTMTCWLTLDDTSRDAGTIEYVPGSHLWPLTPQPDIFEGGDYRSKMRAAAAAAGIEPPEPVFIEVPAGSVVFHAGEIWHGSGPNTTGDRMRRSIGTHFVPIETQFTSRPGGYIYRRYERTDDPTLDESFFPVTWGEGRQPTPWIDSYCSTGRRSAL